MNHRFDLHGLFAFDGSWHRVEFGHPLHGDVERLANVLVGGDDVADPQAEQFVGADFGFRQRHHHVHHGAVDAAGDLLHGFQRRRPFAVGGPVVGRELAANPLNRIERNAHVHHAANFSQHQLETDENDHLIGRHNLHQLRIALHPLDRELERQHVLPGMAQLVEKELRDAGHQAELNFRQRPAGDGARLLAPPQQPVDDRIEDGRVDVENEVAFQRLRPQEVEAGGILQAENELTVGELVHARQLDLDDAAEQSGKLRSEVAAKALVQRLQRPHLLLAHPLRPLEVIRQHALAVAGLRLGHRLLGRARAGAPRLHRGEEAFDFRLAENFVGHGRRGE